MADQSQEPSAEGAKQGEPKGEGSAPKQGAAAEAGGNNGPDLKELKAQLATLSSENQALKSQISGLENAKRKGEGKAKTLEERLADLEQSYQTAQADLAKERRTSRLRDGIEAAISDVPEGKRKAARAIAAGLAGDLDIGAENNAAAIESLRKTLQKDFADVLSAEEPKRVLPHVPGPTNGASVPTAGIGLSNARGERLI